MKITRPTATRPGTTGEVRITGADLTTAGDIAVRFPNNTNVIVRSVVAVQTALTGTVGNPTLGISVVNPVPVAAKATVGSADASFVLTAKQPGTGGNSVSITVAKGGEDAPIEVVVAGSDITVNATVDNGNTITATAEEVVQAINDSPEASALVLASIPDTGDGSDPVVVAAKANLTGGAATSSEGAILSPTAIGLSALGKHAALTIPAGGDVVKAGRDIVFTIGSPSGATVSEATFIVGYSVL